VAGGWLIVGVGRPPDSPLEEVLTNLRNVRNGGRSWTAGEIEKRLRAFNFAGIKTFSPPIPISLVVGRRATGAASTF
jgi:hypothetical protein